MKKNILISTAIICFTVLLVTVIIFVFRKEESKNELTLYGNVDVRQVDIGFRVSGKVNKLHFEEGDYVCAGDLMCLLDETPYNSQLDEAITNAESIAVDLRHADILLKRRLALISSGGVSQEDVDDALASRDRLQANLNHAQAAIAVAKDNLSYTRAYAPTDGVILTRIREPGTVVNPSDPVYTLSVSSPVWVRAFVNEPNLGKVFYGMRADIYTDSGRRYKGNIGFISPIAEFTPKTVETTQLRTDLVYRLRIYVENVDRGLVQGMPVTVKINLDQKCYE